mgnify:CR=1 FL=1
MIDGMWWLVILLTIVIALWLFAKSRGVTASEPQLRATDRKYPVNNALQKTALLIEKHFSDYKVARKNNHLLISRQGKKIAMITIDKKLAAGQRRLGDVPVVNFHRVPSRDLLAVNLQDVE